VSLRFDARDAYQQWVRDLLSPLAKKLGWVPAAGEGDERKTLRAQVLLTLGTTAHDPEVLKEAGKLALEALDKPGTMDVAMASTVFSLAAINGDPEFYDRVLNGVKKASSPGEYYLLLGVLGRFQDPKLLDRTLKLSMSSEIRTQDLANVIGGVMGNAAGEHMAWDFVREHWDDIAKTFGGYNGSGNLVRATNSFCDPELRDQVKDFFSVHPIPDAERTLRQVLEQMNNCIDLKSQQSGPLSAWLEHHGSTTGE